MDIKKLTRGDKVAIFIPLVVLVLVFFGLNFPPGIIQSVSYKSFVAIIACICLWSVLRLNDLSAGFKFSTWWTDEKNTQRGTYLCFRLVAFAMVVSFVFAFA